MKIIINGEVVEVVEGGSGGVTMDQVNTAIQDAVADIQPQEVYSTDEQRIGTWINGKPLYRKVISTVTGELNEWTQVYSPGNIETIVSFYGMIDDATDRSFQQFPQAYICTKMKNNNAWLYVISASNLANRPCICCIEYTKTTD